MTNIKTLILTVLTALLLMCNANAQQANPVAATQKFQPTDESLRQYKYPEWFRDAKFGIWAHWGPQAVPRQGDSYAKYLYVVGTPQYKHHLANYGPPSISGYKDIIPLWKAEKWDPDKLMELYKRAGAKYFVSMGSHHDNFFLWNSKIHQWNAVNMGPHKDVVGIWQKAAKKEGLKFGVSEHLAASFNWYQPSHGADKNGPYAGIPYDGHDPKYAELYHVANPDSADMKKWVTDNNDWKKEWLADVSELIDNYHPDLLYSDSPLPFGDVGREMLAHYYNDNMVTRGRLEAVYTPKQPSEGKWVQDVERGVLDSICPYPWQTDTSIGDWFYRTGQRYRSADEIAQLLIDIVSKNGNLLLNVVQTPEGDLEPDELSIVEKIGDWTAANAEGIYATRPWKVYGEGPSTAKANQQKGRYGGLSDNTKGYKPSDFRFTTRGNAIYAFCMSLPDGDLTIRSLGKNAGLLENDIVSVSMLGTGEKLKWTQTDDGLIITKPANLTAWLVTGYKITLKKK